MYSMSVSAVVPADRQTVFRALLDPDSDDPALAGVITLTTTLRDDGDGTEVEMRFGGMPDAVARADNEAGTRMSLAKLARLVG